MHAFLLNIPQISPRPARGGFSVPSQIDTHTSLARVCSEVAPFDDISNILKSDDDFGIIHKTRTSSSHWLFNVNSHEMYLSDKDTSFSFSLDAEETLTSLRIRCSSVSGNDGIDCISSRRNRFSDYDELESNGNTTTSTSDSGSIGTPPASVTLPIAALDAELCSAMTRNDEMRFADELVSSEDLTSFLDFSSPTL